MPLTYNSPAENENTDVFMPLYTGKRRRTRTLTLNDQLPAARGHDQSSINLFDKEQLAKLLIHALRELGFNNSAQALQEETGGIQVESSVVQTLFNIIRNGDFEKITLSLLSQLPLKYGTLSLEPINGVLHDIQKHEIETCELSNCNKEESIEAKTNGEPSNEDDNFIELSKLSSIKEDNSMKIENILSESTDWQKVIIQMQRELKKFEALLPTSEKSYGPESIIQLISIVEIMVLINREIFLELIFDQKDSPMAVLFLRNILRKFIQLWDSLLSMKNDLLDEDATFTPDNLLREMTTVLTSPVDWTQRSSMWQGSLTKSRGTLIEEISDYINPNDLVPRGRLVTLLKQAIKYQRSQDVLYMTDDSDNHMEDEIEEAGNLNSKTTTDLPNNKFNLLQDNTSSFQQIKFREEKTLLQNVDEIWFLQFSPDGRYLASASADSLTDRKIIIYDVENDFQVYKVLGGSDQCVLYLSFSPDSRYIVSCPFNEVANIYDIHAKGEPTFINPKRENGIVAEIIQPVDSFQIPGSTSATGASPNNCGGPPRIWCCDWFHTAEHEGRFIVGSPDREVVIYDLKSKTVLLKLSASTCATPASINSINQPANEPFPRVHDLKITADDRYLILMPHQGNIDIYDLLDFPNNEMVEKNEVVMDKVVLPRISRLNIPRRMTCISLPQTRDFGSPLASLLLVSLQSNELQLWDFEEQILVQKYLGQKQEQFIIRSCFGYNDKLIVSGSEDGKIYVWDRINGNIIGVLTAHVADRPVPNGSNKKSGKNCNVVVWSPSDKSLFASGGDDGYIKIWRVGKG